MRMSSQNIARKLVELKAAGFNKVLSVVFIKRTTGLPRRMALRFGVTRHLSGGELPYNPEDCGLLPVFDMNKRDYRMVDLSGILSARIDKKNYHSRRKTCAGYTATGSTTTTSHRRFC